MTTHAYLYCPACGDVRSRGWPWAREERQCLGFNGNLCGGILQLFPDQPLAEATLVLGGPDALDLLVVELVGYPTSNPHDEKENRARR